MDFWLNLIFYGSLTLILHSYIIYPFSIWLLSIMTNKNYTSDNSVKPIVSVLISAYNEEKVIENTIRKLFESNYPVDKIEVIVGTDKSEDNTNDILGLLSKEYSNLKILKFNERRGKASVLNDLFKVANGSVLMFCDANTIYKPDAISKLVCYYCDEKVGGVSGKLKLQDFEESIQSGSQEKRYWDAETWLKEKEGKLGILIGANGGIYSIRRELFSELPINYPVMDDFYLSLKVLEKGKDFLYIKDAIAEEFTAPTIKAEFHRKIRNNSVNLFTIKPIKNVLKPVYGLRAYGLWSHKIIRWFSPVLLIGLFLSNIILFNQSLFFKVFFFAQLLFYLSAIFGFFFKRIKIFIKPLLLAYYFCMTNIAMLIGLIKFLFNKQTPFWQSTPR